MDSLIQKIYDTLKKMLIEMNLLNLQTMFTDVNEKVGSVAAEVGKTPQEWNAGIFSIIRSLAETVIFPIAGMIIAFVLCCELISMAVEKNSMHDVDTFMFFKFVFKAFVAVMLVTHSVDITMAIFEVSQHVVNQAGALITGETSVDISAVLNDMAASMEEMGLAQLALLLLETVFIQFGMKIMSILITVILYIRMVEIYIYCSIGPIPFATLANKEWGAMGQNYIRGLAALGFQGFFILVCVGIYGALVQSVTLSGNIHLTIFQILCYTVILCFSLFKTSSLSKSVFNAH